MAEPLEEKKRRAQAELDKLNKKMGNHGVGVPALRAASGCRHEHASAEA